MNQLERSGLFARREGGRNYSAIRNKLQLVKDVDGENQAEMQLMCLIRLTSSYVTSGYAPISVRLVEWILREGRLPPGSRY